MAPLSAATRDKTPQIEPMNMRVNRSNSEPLRTNLSMEQRWNDADHGLIWCWERGREIAQETPEKAARARAGELLSLSWKGGGDEAIKPNKRHGTFKYMAMLQGLRGADLDIDTGHETTLVCPKTNTVVCFTTDPEKFR